MIRGLVAAFVLAGVVFASSVLLRGADAPEPAKGDVRPVRLFTLPQYTEGIVFDRDGRGYVSHGKSISRFTLDGKHEIWAETGGPNGHRILADGTHLVCDRSHKAVLRLSENGKRLSAAAGAFEGKRLMGPNDLALDPANNGFYFTDPETSDLNNRIGAVYYVDKTDGTGTVRRVDAGLAYPNGVVLTPDGRRLYVAETLTNQVHVYDVGGPGEVGVRRLFAELPKADPALGQTNNFPDGMCLDAAGNLYVAHFGMRRVQVLDPEGRLIASHESGNLTTSNVAFGGPALDQLFVTGALGGLGESEGAVFRLDLGVKGRPLPPQE